MPDDPRADRANPALYNAAARHEGHASAIVEAVGLATRIRELLDCADTESGVVSDRDPVIVPAEPSSSRAHRGESAEL